MVRIKQPYILKHLLRVAACLAALYFQGEAATPDDVSATLFAGFEKQLICDVRWWLQMPPIENVIAGSGLDDTAFANECRH